MKKVEKSNNTDIQTLSPIEHIKLRPTMYIGGVTPGNHDEWLFDGEKVEFKTLTYVEGLLKLCNEAIDNAIDEHIKSNYEYSTKINIEMTKDTFTCEDNGRGIPTKKTDDGETMAEKAVCVPMSGSNFNDSNRTQIGQNGLGIKAANIFSTSFECVTCDGKKKLKISCKDNLSSKQVKELTPSTKTGTQITFKPDFKRFSVKEFDSTIISLVKTRLKFLSWFFPKCTISFNGEKMVAKAKDLASMFPEPSIVINEPNAYICVYPSEEPYVLSYVNGISLREGGSQVDYISNKVIEDIRDKVSKKFKMIKPADIRNRLGFVVFFNNFPNCSFDSQTKKKLTNSWGEVGDFIRNNNIDLDKFTDKIIHTKEVIDNITELFRLKEELAEQKELAKLNKTKKDISSEKYFPPVGKTDKKYLMITEGFSAFSGISPILGRQGIGYYMLKGKIKNIIDEKPSNFMKNQEIQELVQILGINIGGETTDMNYEKVVILTDQDPDGFAINGLCLTLFSIIAPKMVEEGRVCRLNTPLLIGKKNDKIVEWYYDLGSAKSLNKNVNYFYVKGLGSHQKNDLQYIIAQEGGMDKMLLPFTADKKYHTSINNWFGNDSDIRKKFLIGREFHISNV